MAPGLHPAGASLPTLFSNFVKCGNPESTNSLKVLDVAVPIELVAINAMRYKPRSFSVGVQSNAPVSGSKIVPRGWPAAVSVTAKPLPSPAVTAKWIGAPGLAASSAGAVRAGELAGSTAIEVRADSEPIRASKTAVPKVVPASAAILKANRLCPARAPTLRGTFRLALLV